MINKTRAAVTKQGLNKFCGYLAFCTLGALPLSADSPLTPTGSGIHIEASDLPSALWPQYISTTEDIQLGEVLIKKGSRGTLQRCEEDSLVVDFGRHGVLRISPAATDYYEQASALMLDEETKSYPNLTIQIGNKLMRFRDGTDPTGIKLEEVANTQLYLLIYLDKYDPNQAPELDKFGKKFEEIQIKHPEILAVILAKDRDYYNFGYTIGYNIPFIVPHLRLGYIESLGHSPSNYPYMVLTDPNGRIMATSNEDLDLSNMSEILEGWMSLLNNK